MPTPNTWTTERLRALHDQPLPELLYQAQTVHRAHHDPATVQRCTLLSVKTGRCPEDCAYCPQSAHHETGLDGHDLLEVDTVLASAEAAREAGATRFCMGAAWREVRDGERFDAVLEMVRGVRALGMEACVTLGMLNETQAARLAEAGLTAYNHNLDTGPGYYGEIITTRTYQDRLDTLARVGAAGIGVCCGGILGMGESIEDRLAMLAVLAQLDPAPESVPINTLVRVQGTPLADAPPVDPIEVVRLIACTRIAIPRCRVRLSAGRTQMSDEAQALCFVAGANSVFAGERLLTTPNPGDDADDALFARLGLRTLESAAVDEQGHEQAREGQHEEEAAQVGDSR